MAGNGTLHLEDVSLDFDQLELVSHWKFTLDGVLLTFVSLFGLIGNSLALKVVLSNDLGLGKTFRTLLALLLSSDIVFVTLAWFLFSLPLYSLHFRFRIYPLLVPFVLPLTQIVINISSYTVLSIAIGRFLSICRPHLHVPDNKEWWHVFWIISWSILTCVHYFFELDTTEVTQETLEEKTTLLVVKPTALRINKNYFEISSLLALLLNLVTLLLLIFLNWSIYSR